MMQNMKTEPDKFFQMRTTDAFLRNVDVLRKREDDLPSRADMLRRLVDRSLAFSAAETTKGLQATGRARKR